MGALMVRSDNPRRVWEENEILLMRTVADQVAVAVNHARLFQETQRSPDGWPDRCYNRRSFEMQLVRDLHMASRMSHPLSLIMLDVDSLQGRQRHLRPRGGRCGAADAGRPRPARAARRGTPPRAVRRRRVAVILPTGQL